MAALKELYDSTNGATWYWFNATPGVAWNFSVPDANPCTTPRWEGVACSLFPVKGFLHVIGLALDLHGIRGTIPASLGNLTQLHGMSLASNVFTGTIPHTMSNWKQAKVLDFSNNFLESTVPVEITELPALRAFYIYDNYLNGTIPSFICQLSKLEVLKLTYNHLTGHLPKCLDNLTDMKLFYVARNKLSGKIPKSVGYMRNLTTLQLDDNLFTGPIPNSLVYLKDSILNMYLDVNLLTGPIPDYFANMTKLAALYLNGNQLTGTIPLALTRVNALVKLYLHDNLLSGTIPADFSNVTKNLNALELQNNFLTGTIPDTLADIPSIQILELSYNYFTGTIPKVLGTVESFKTLELGGNHLTGTIPPILGSLPNLTNLYLNENYFHGKIPEELGQLAGVTYFYLYTNFLSGTIPDSLSQLGYLASMFLQNNKLRGSLDNKFNATKQKFLNVIQLSDNQFTGQLPDEIFLLPELTTFVAVSNCFYGTIPTAMCNVSDSQLETLVLDGLRSAPVCQRRMLPGLSQSYALTDRFHGGLPLCIFTIPKLVTFHVSGNGLTGTLPKHLEVSERLVDVSLSHNRFTGSIPYVFQEKLWYNLDLSYNKFGGILEGNFAKNQTNITVQRNFGFFVDRNLTRSFKLPSNTFSARNNRLSDEVPDALLNMVNITILAGNLFACDLEQHGLPQNDPARSTYTCGSNSFNVSYYIWLAMTVFVAIAVLAMYYWRQQLDDYIGFMSSMTKISRWLNVVNWSEQRRLYASSRLHQYKYVCMVTDMLMRLSCWITLYICAVMLPLYCVLSNYYGTHNYEYAWSVSIAFLTGSTPFAVLFFFLCVLLLVLLYFFRATFRELRLFLHDLPRDFHFYSFETILEEEIAEKKESKYASKYEQFGIYAAFFVLNFAIVLGVNVAYVYILIYENSAYIVAAQVSLSIFKLMWNSVGSVYLIRWTHHYLASNSTKDWKERGTGFFTIQLFVAMFNYIGIPALVVAAVSPNCFNNVVVNAPKVTSRYYYEYCAVFGTLNGCLLTDIALYTTTYAPPFTYSFECGSSVITYYAPTFVYMCFIVTFINPIIEVVSQQLMHRAKRGTWWFDQLEYWIPPILQDVNAETDHLRQPYDIFNPFFDGNYFLVTVVTYVGVLLTFGVLFPPLGIALLITIFTVVYTTKIEIGRFLSHVVDQNLHKYIDLLEKECQGIGSIPKLRQVVRMLMVFACMFYTLFLFDTLGDAIGVSNAWWVIVVFPLVPLMFFLGHLGYIYYSHRGMGEGTGSFAVSIELRKSDMQGNHAKKMVEMLSRESLQAVAAAAMEVAASSTTNPLVRDIESDSRNGDDADGDEDVNDKNGNSTAGCKSDVNDNNKGL
jgi:Leucine-rich repeat (LRR) protein